jgi:hypothetical protein
MRYSAAAMVPPLMPITLTDAAAIPAGENLRPAV